MKGFTWFGSHHQLHINFLILIILLLVRFGKINSDLLPWTELNQKSSGSFNKSLDSLVALAEELSLSQRNQKEIAAVAAKQKLADVSSLWAKFVQQLTLWKANEVKEITRKAQEAQVLSLRIDSISTRLQNAVSSAQNVFDSAFERYKILSTLAKAAETHSATTKMTFTLLNNVHSVRENWALEERQRAMRLSQYLQNILYDMKKATELSEDAHDYAMLASQFKYFKYKKR